MISLTKCHGCGSLIPAEAYHSDGICPFCNPNSDERKVTKEGKTISRIGTLKTTEGVTRAAAPSDQLSLWGNQ